MSKPMAIGLLVFVLIMSSAFAVTVNVVEYDTLLIGENIIVISCIYLLAGMIMAFIKKTNETGKGFLFGAGMSLLIGIAICSSQL